MELSQLIGNEALKRQLNLQAGRRGLSHAYILSGPAGSGKRTLAGILAAALVCAAPEERRPCLACAACRKAAGGIHPDIVRIGEDGKEIPVSQVRALRSDAYIRPNEARRKVYVVENAHNLNPSAQNAMLKLLEEGPAYGAFLLLTENASALLETVRSRCEVLSLSPVTPAEAEGWLAEQFPKSTPQERRQAAEQCGGLLGRAKGLLEGGEEAGQTVRETAQALLARIAGGDELRLLELCVTLEKWDRADLSALLEETVLQVRDALLWGAGTRTEPARRREEAKAAAQALSPRQLSQLADKLEQLRSACGFNVGTGHLAGWLCAAASSL